MKVRQFVETISTRWGETIGNHLPFVSVVYITVLLPWGFLYFHDFISSKWTTVKQTFRAGIIHIIVVSVPMPILILYIIFQQTAIEKDHKEMYAAITALVLSIYHLARTIWGLHQLACFKRWALATALVCERAAFKVLKTPTVNVSHKSMSTTRRSSSFTNSRPSSAHPSPSLSPLKDPSKIPISSFNNFKLPPFQFNSQNQTTPTPSAPESKLNPLSFFRNRSSSLNHQSQHQKNQNNLKEHFSALSNSKTKKTSPTLPILNPGIKSFSKRGSNLSPSLKHLSSQLSVNNRISRSSNSKSYEHTVEKCRTHDLRTLSSTSLTTLLLDTEETMATESVKCDPFNVNSACMSTSRRKEIEKEISNMKINSTIIDNEFIASDAPRTKFFTNTFVNPHDAFIRWSICYLSQFGNTWLKESKTKSFDNLSWDGKRYNLALDVWLTCSLRMETTCSNFSNNQVSLGIPTNNSTIVSFLSPALWYFFLPERFDHLFSKDNLLYKCMSTGEGFPYSRSIIEDREALPSIGMYDALIKDVLADLPAYLYDVVDDIVPEQLHWFAIFIWIAQWNGCEKDDPTLRLTQSNLLDDQTSFSPLSLEGNIGESVLKPNHAPVRTLQDQLGLDDDITLDLCPFPFIRQRYGRYLWRNRSVLQVSERIDNWLSLRIGHHYTKLFKQYAGLYGSNTESYTKVHSFELNENNDDIIIRDDYNIFKDINKTDIIRSLICKAPSNLVDSKKGNRNKTNRIRSNVEKRSDKIFGFHRRLEIDRLRYQLTRIDVPLHHLDQGITFMGCAMETVRSFLAEDVHHNLENTPETSSTNIDGKETNKEKLKPDFPFRPGSIWMPKLHPDKYEIFHISGQLFECLRVIDLDGDVRFDSTVQERLLFEVQNGLVKTLDNQYLQNHQFSIRAPEKLQLIILAILSFPGLNIKLIKKSNSYSKIAKVSKEYGEEQGRVINDDEDQQTRTTTSTSTESKNAKFEFLKDVLTFEIEVPAGPQHISVIIEASAKLRQVKVRLQFNNEEETHFRWQDWRDAFLGRLSGKAEWQRVHFMKNLPINRKSSKLISSLFRYDKAGKDRPIPVWEGWEPFRARIRKFELEHSSLIIVGQVMPADNAFLSPSTSLDGEENDDFPSFLEHNFTQRTSTFDSRRFGKDSNENIDEISKETQQSTNLSIAGPSSLTGKKEVRFEVRATAGGAGLSGNISTISFNANDESSPYERATEDSLTDASFFLDSVLGLNSLFDGGPEKELTKSMYKKYASRSPRSEDDIGFQPTSQRFSPDRSAEEMVPPATFSNFTEPGGQVDDLINRVNEQEVAAMAELATYLLHGTTTYKRDHERALSLMERAITISKDIVITDTYIRTLLEAFSSSSNKSDKGGSKKHLLNISENDGSKEANIMQTQRNESIVKALYVVDLLWRDMPTRFEVVVDNDGIKKLKAKSNNSKDEEQRIRKLVNLHLKLIEAKRSADVMCDLGNQISTWGTSKYDERLAINLYESAIIADCNVWAMVGLALIYAHKDTIYAKKLFYRAINDNWDVMMKDNMNIPSMMEADARNTDVVDHVQYLKMHGDSRAAILLEHI